MKRWQHIGCFLAMLLGCLGLGGCAVRFFQSTRREPELSVQQLLHKQLEVFPPGWTLDGAEIWTDTDFTWARWAVAAHFGYEGDFVSEEVHIFRNPLVARIITRPSPPSLAARKGYIPEGWTYRPPHADRFEFGCSGGEGVSQPKWCSLILRYEEYIIVLGAPIGDHLTLSDLQRILEVIDKEMNDYLQHSTLCPGLRSVPASLDE